MVKIFAMTKIWLAIKNHRERRKRGNDNSAKLRNLLEPTSDEEDLEPTFSIIERPTPQKPLSESVEEREEEAIAN